MSEVRLLRRRTGVSQKRLAQLAGTSQPTIAAYESGRKTPSLRTLRRLAQAVGLEARTLFVPPTTREDRRSLALHEEIAERLMKSPDDVLRLARQTLALMRERKPGVFCLQSREFLHFHEDSAGVFADVRFSDEFVRMPVTSAAEQADLLGLIDDRLTSIESRSTRRLRRPGRRRARAARAEFD